MHETRSDAVVVVRDGEEVLRWERHPGRAYNTHSITKSISAIAIGQLVDEGLVDLDLRMGEVFPEWTDERAAITLEQVLNHSSGLEVDRAPIPLRPLRYALRSELEHPPGTVYAYSNNASNLLSGVVEHAAGHSLEAQLVTGVFEPLGIEGARWGVHRGPTPAWSGLRLTADDLVAIGQALLDGELLQPRTLQTLTSPGGLTPWSGLHWWPVHTRSFVVDRDQVDLLVKRGMPVERAEPLRELAGTRSSSWAEAWALLDEDPLLQREIQFHGMTPIAIERHRVGFAAKGWAGQHLVVLPEVRVVAVRQRGASHERRTDERVWEDFAQDVIELLELEETLRSGPPARWER